MKFTLLIGTLISLLSDEIYFTNWHSNESSLMKFTLLIGTLISLFTDEIYFTNWHSN